MTLTPELVALAAAVICFLIAACAVFTERAFPPGGWVAFGLMFLALFFLLPALTIGVGAKYLVLLAFAVIVVIVWFVKRTG